MRVRPWVAAAVCLPLLALSACSDDDPKADPEPTDSVSTPTPTEPETPDEPVEPEEPAAMANEDEAGAEAFVEYYWEVLNYSMASGSTDRLRDLSFEICKPCTNGADEVDKVYSNGGEIRGGEFHVQSQEVQRLTSGANATFQSDFILRVKKQTIIESAGASPERSKAAKVSFTFLVSQDDQGAWRVSEWRVL